MKRRMVVSVLVAVAVAGCAETGARSAPPDVVDEWLPPAGVDLDSEKVYRENRDLFDYDQQVPLDIQQVGTGHSEGITAYDLTYASPKGGRVPATLLVPDGGGPFAGLVLMHGLPSNRSEMSQQATAYAGMGAVVITIDAPFARPENAGRDALLLTEQDREEQIQLIVDLRRAVDLLLSRPEVDPQRMAYIGVSYGGAMGGLLAGVENRLKAYMLLVGDGGLVTHLTGPEDRRGGIYGLADSRREAWLEAMWPIEPIHYVGRAAPAALLFQNGTVDTLVPPADGLRYQQAGSEPKTMLWYKSGHGLLSQATDDEVGWLDDHIGVGELVLLQPSFRVSALRIDRVLLVWLALTIGALFYLIWALWRDRARHWGNMLVWSLVVLFFGPLGLLAYLYLYRRPKRDAEPGAAIPLFGRALGSTVWSAAGNLAGVLVIMILAAYQGPLVILVPLGTGLLMHQLSRFPTRQDDPWINHSQPLTVQILSTNMILAGAYLPVLVIGVGRLDRWYPFGEPIWAVWTLLALGTVAGTLTGYPVHRWMVGRGLVRWGPDLGEIKREARSLPRYPALGLMLLTFAVLATSLAVAKTLLG